MNLNLFIIFILSLSNVLLANDNDGFQVIPIIRGEQETSIRHIDRSLVGKTIIYHDGYNSYKGEIVQVINYNTLGLTVKIKTDSGLQISRIPMSSVEIEFN